MFPYGTFPKLGGTILGVPLIRTMVFWGLYWGPPNLGNYHMSHNLNSSKSGDIRDCKGDYYRGY